jgi:hypothetical protein
MNTVAVEALPGVVKALPRTLEALHGAVEMLIV